MIIHGSPRNLWLLPFRRRWRIVKMVSTCEMSMLIRTNRLVVKAPVRIRDKPKRTWREAGRKGEKI